jgi:hypothetical protein
MVMLKVKTSGDGALVVNWFIKAMLFLELSSVIRVVTDFVAIGGIVIWIIHHCCGACYGLCDLINELEQEVQ